jgi:hypothetical protein
MKLLASLFLFSLAAPAPAPAAEEPPPFECPLCGGDPGVHVRRVSTLVGFNARVVQACVDSLLGR